MLKDVKIMSRIRRFFGIILSIVCSIETNASTNSFLSLAAPITYIQVFLISSEFFLFSKNANKSPAENLFILSIKNMAGYDVRGYGCHMLGDAYELMVQKKSSLF